MFVFVFVFLFVVSNEKIRSFEAVRLVKYCPPSYPQSTFVFFMCAVRSAVSIYPSLYRVVSDCSPSRVVTDLSVSRYVSINPFLYYVVPKLFLSSLFTCRSNLVRNLFFLLLRPHLSTHLFIVSYWIYSSLFTCRSILVLVLLRPTL